jgi:hypothetical protein
MTDNGTSSVSTSVVLFPTPHACEQTDGRMTARSPLQAVALCRMPISQAITRTTRPRPVAGAQTMPGSADIGHLLARIHIRILPHSGLNRRATPFFAEERPADTAIIPHAPAGRRQS